MKLKVSPKFNPGKGLSDSLKKTASDLTTGNVKEALTNPANVTSDISKAGKAAGGSIKNASDTSIGNPAAKAWHTSVLDPTNKAVAQAKDMAAKWGGKAEDWWNKMQNSPSGGMNIPKVGGGVGGGMPGGGAPSGPVQISAIQGGMSGPGGNQNEFRAQQMTLAQQLAQQAAGQGPSLATEQLKQSQAANQAATFAQLASARGGANPGMARQAMQTSAQIQGQTARDAALARIQEQMGAREQLAGVAGQGRQGDIQVAGQGNELAVAQAQLAQQHAELQAKYAALGLDAEKANQMAALEMEKMDRGLMSPAQQALQAGTGILTSIFT